MLKTTHPFRRDPMFARGSALGARATTIRGGRLRELFQLCCRVLCGDGGQAQRRNIAGGLRCYLLHDHGATTEIQKHPQRQAAQRNRDGNPIPAMPELRGTRVAKIAMLQPTSLRWFVVVAIATFGAKV